jgi:hypothetical protein
LFHSLAYVQIRHLRVKQYDIGMKSLCAADCFGRMIRFGEHAQVRLEQKASDKGAPDERRVFQEQ